METDGKALYLVLESMTRNILFFPPEIYGVIYRAFWVLKSTRDCLREGSAMIYAIFIKLILSYIKTVQFLADLFTQHNPIEHRTPKIIFQTFVEHFHLLEIYYHILIHTSYSSNYLISNCRKYELAALSI
jgi:hypothetical protein